MSIWVDNPLPGRHNVSDAGRLSTQTHLSNALIQPLDYDDEVIESERVQSHAKEITKDSLYADTYTNVDVTVTVDPMHNKRWITEDGDKYILSRRRGRAKEHEAVVGVLNHVDDHTDHPAPPQTFVPTPSMLDASLKFSAFCIDSSTRGMYKTKDAGELPVVAQLLWDNKLNDKPDWAIDRELQEERNFSRDRTFDCNGLCR